MTQGYTLSGESIRQLKKVVREWYAVWKNEQTSQPYYGQVRDTRRWAILDADLLAAVDMFTDPSTATAHLLDRKANGDLEVTDEKVTVVNRFENISIDADTLIGIEFMCGEWTPYKADCGPNSQGASSLLASISPGASVGGP